jgi:hypothetical protein
MSRAVDHPLANRPRSDGNCAVQVSCQWIAFAGAFPTPLKSGLVEPATLHRGVGRADFAGQAADFAAWAIEPRIDRKVGRDAAADDLLDLWGRIINNPSFS